MSVSEVLAEAMWRGVPGRPCGWDELDADEQAEWSAMAKIALYVIERSALDFITTFDPPNRKRVKPKDVVGLAKVMAYEAVYNSLHDWEG